MEMEKRDKKSLLERGGRMSEKEGKREGERIVSHRYMSSRDRYLQSSFI